jgi:hypothetical protein
MEQLFKYVLGEMRLIAQTPVVFAMAVLVVGGAIWWAMGWRYSGIIANRDSEISSLRTQRDEYKDKLSGASPDQAAHTIKSLTEQVAALRDKEGERSAKEWPMLTSKQITEWSISLAKYKPSFLAVFFTDPYPEQFRESLFEVFRNANWPNPTVLNAGYVTGIRIRAAENEPVALELLRLMDSLPVQKAYEYETPPTAGKVQIYIGKRN